jgi:hypothetical protein
MFLKMIFSFQNWIPKTLTLWCVCVCVCGFFFPANFHNLVRKKELSKDTHIKGFSWKKWAQVVMRKINLRSSHLYVEIREVTRINENKFYCPAWHLARFGLLLLWMVANPPTSQNWFLKKNLLMYYGLLIFPIRLKTYFYSQVCFANSGVSGLSA